MSDKNERKTLGDVANQVRVLAGLARHHQLRSTLDTLARRDLSRRYDATPSK